MGLYRYAPKPSGRMGLLWTLGGIPNTAILEFGSMGHMLYAERWLFQSAPFRGGKLYTTHLDEKDIALGITKRFFQAVEEIIKKEAPSVIFVLPSTVPAVTGVDMEDLCYEAEETYGQKIIMLKRGSFHEKLHHGIEEGLFCLVNEFAKKAKIQRTEGITCNLIGSCIDLAKYYSDVQELKRIVKEAFGMEVICSLTSETSIEQVKNMGGAHINLVLRKEGIKAAEVLKDAFGTDYVYGRPYGYEGTIAWLKEIGEKLSLVPDKTFVEKECLEGERTFLYCKQMASSFGHNASISIGGNYDVAKGIMNFATKELGLKKNYVWCDVKEYEDEDVPYQAEDDLIKYMTKDLTGILMADRTAFEMAKREEGLIINRSLNNRVFNPYDTPYVGFRGALNLCALWIEELMGKR